MTFRLIRNIYAADGVFGQLVDESGNLLCFTLEHAYPTADRSFVAKVPVGMYTCRRGTHCLSGGAPFSTFEITGVSGHTGILFHTGNVNSDSEGCVLVGTSIIRSGSFRELSSSRLAFEKFLHTVQSVDSFSLEVSNE